MKRTKIFLLDLLLIICALICVSCGLYKNREPETKDGNYYIKSFDGENILLQSADEPQAYLNASVSDGTMFYMLVSESGINMHVSCSYDEFADSWEAENIYYVIFSGNTPDMPCISVIREGTEHITGRYEYLDDTQLGQKLFKLRDKGERIELIPVEYVDITNEQRINKLVQAGVVAEADLNKTYEHPYIPVEHQEQIRKVKVTSDTRYYIINTTGADRCSKDEISHFFMDSDALYRIILEEDKIECLIYYSY